MLAATASRFLDDACEELGLADGVHEWLRASERELTVKVAIPGADGGVRCSPATACSTAACAAPPRAVCASTTRSRSRRRAHSPSS